MLHQIVRFGEMGVIFHFKVQFGCVFCEVKKTCEMKCNGEGDVNAK